jgi:hypothetical protein
MGNAAANGPYAEWLMGEVIKHNNLWICQRVCRFASDQTWVVRYKINGVWSAWSLLVTKPEHVTWYAVPLDVGLSNIGSFCLAYNTTDTTIPPGETIAGSALLPSSLISKYNYTLIGTWRCLGYGAAKTATLWQRIA